MRKAAGVFRPLERMDRRGLTWDHLIMTKWTGAGRNPLLKRWYSDANGTSLTRDSPFTSLSSSRILTLLSEVRSDVCSRETLERQERRYGDRVCDDRRADSSRGNRSVQPRRHTT
jgi:hypothetical protein